MYDTAGKTSGPNNFIGFGALICVEFNQICFQTGQIRSGAPAKSQTKHPEQNPFVGVQGEDARAVAGVRVHGAGRRDLSGEELLKLEAKVLIVFIKFPNQVVLELKPERAGRRDLADAGQRGGGAGGRRAARGGGRGQLRHQRVHRVARQGAQGAAAMQKR
jgi:hypothetical protein